MRNEEVEETEGEKGEIKRLRVCERVRGEKDGLMPPNTALHLICYSPLPTSLAFSSIFTKLLCTAWEEATKHRFFFLNRVSKRI